MNKLKFFCWKVSICRRAKGITVRRKKEWTSSERRKSLLMRLFRCLRRIAQDFPLPCGHVQNIAQKVVFFLSSFHVSYLSKRKLSSRNEQTTFQDAGVERIQIKRRLSILILKLLLKRVLLKGFTKLSRRLLLNTIANSFPRDLMRQTWIDDEFDCGNRRNDPREKI